MSKRVWQRYATYLADECGVFVDWEEEFYICPKCGKPVYECDWGIISLIQFVCPICHWEGE